MQLPAESGNRHWVTRHLRVGTLDEPQRFPPLAHIFLRSKQPWVVLGSEVTGFDAHYPAEQWPAASRQRWAEACAQRRRAT